MMMAIKFPIAVIAAIVSLVSVCAGEVVMFSLVYLNNSVAVSSR